MRLPRLLRTPGTRPAQLPNRAPLLGRRLTNLQLGRMAWEAAHGLSRQLSPRSSRQASSQLAILAAGRQLGWASGVAGQPSYYAYQQGMSEDLWGYPSTGGPAYPGVYNPYP